MKVCNHARRVSLHRTFLAERVIFLVKSPIGFYIEPPWTFFKSVFSKKPQTVYFISKLTGVSLTLIQAGIFSSSVLKVNIEISFILYSMWMWVVKGYKKKIIIKKIIWSLLWWTPKLFSRKERWVSNDNRVTMLMKKPLKRIMHLLFLTLSCHDYFNSFSVLNKVCTFFFVVQYAFYHKFYTIWRSLKHN